MGISSLAAPVVHRDSLAHLAHSHSPTIHARGIAAHHDAAHAAVKHVVRSNMPAERKAAAIRGYWDGLQDRLHALVPAKAETNFQKSISQVGSLARQDIAAGLTGYGIAYLEHVVGKLDIKGVPLDLIVAGAGGAAAIASPHLGIDAVAPELRTISSTAVGIWSYRKGKEHLASSPSVHGQSLSDLANEL
jgi:hypothetical protein